MKRFLLIISAVGLLGGCARIGTLTANNKSQSVIRNLIVLASGTDIFFGAIAGGAQKKNKLDPRPIDNTEMTLSFDADGKHYGDKMPSHSWRGMKEVIFSINPDFSVTYESVTTF